MNKIRKVKDEQSMDGAHSTEDRPSIVIANPIYDYVFKDLMLNERIARFFIGTLLDEKVVSVHLHQQEVTYRNKERLSLGILRMDFVAVIKNDKGESKKVLIEIQKARKIADLIRFRHYLGSQYQTEDTIDNKLKTLPIIPIYVLGFNLPELKSACVRVSRDYTDMITKKTIAERSHFIEQLSHDCYIVQACRITDRYQTRLDKLLSVFQQTDFLDEKERLKGFSHPLDDENMQELATKLQHTAADPELRKILDDEIAVKQTLDERTAESDEKLVKAVKKFEKTAKKLEEKEKAIEESVKVIEEKEKAIEESVKVIEEKEKAIEESVKVIEEKEKAIEESVKVIEEKEKAIEEKDKSLAESVKVIEEKDKAIEELRRQLAQK